ncbi:complex I NDUFA9 subunit family protein [Halobacteriales archaeon QS_8_69_26]|nr:MAG: complex I NDUFA9 subunit family protein [Halobacteriales archaeon QS_8_69_26]
MNVLVGGGTGFIGTTLCAELVERGHDVTALSRDPSGADLPSAVETYPADVRDYDDVEPAFENQDAVVYLVALSPLFKTPSGLTHEAVHLGGAENTVRAAEEHGVDRLVHMSGVFADPNADTAYLRSKGKAEEVVRDSDLEWVVYRPTIVFGDGDEFKGFVKMLTTPYVTGLPGGGRVRYQPVWVGDVVPMLADGVEDEDRAGDTYEIGGPERLSLADVTRMIYRSEGKSVTILPVPTILARVGLRVMDPVPFFPLGADQAKSMDTDLVVENNAVTEFGVETADLKTYGQYLGIE